MVVLLVSTLPLAVAVSAASWLVLVAAAVAARRRHAQRRRRFAETAAHGSACAVDDRRCTDPTPHVIAALRPENHPRARALLEAALSSGDDETRRAAVVRLGQLGTEHHWAVDGLLRALTTGADTPMRVAAQLDRLFPRPATRLVGLLGHPDATIRFWALRLLAPYGGLAEERVVALLDDPAPRVRAAALSCLTGTSAMEALRRAMELLDDDEPRVRAHACRAVVAIGGTNTACFVVPLLGDSSWWVRLAAHDVLKRLGQQVADVLASYADAGDFTVRSAVAILLGDLGDKSPQTPPAQTGDRDLPADDTTLLGRPDDLAVVGGRP